MSNRNFSSQSFFSNFCFHFVFVERLNGGRNAILVEGNPGGKEEKHHNHNGNGKNGPKSSVANSADFSENGRFLILLADNIFEKICSDFWIKNHQNQQIFRKFKNMYWQKIEKNHQSDYKN